MGERRGAVEEGWSAGWRRRTAWHVEVEEAAATWMWTWSQRTAPRR